MSEVGKVADKIRKLLSLATSSNVNEAAAAAAQAQKLMQEHKLSMADVEVAVDDNKIAELPIGSDGFMAGWKFGLVTGVARAFFFEVIALRRGQRRRIRVVGKKTDAEVAVGVFNYLVKEIDKLADHDVETPRARSLIASNAIDVRGYKEKFREGAATGVTAKLAADAKTFTESSEKALVIVNRSKDELRDYLKNKYGESKRPEQKAPESDAASEAFSRGYVRGLDITVPRTGGAERYLPGKVEPPKPPPSQPRSRRKHADMPFDRAGLESDLRDFFEDLFADLMDEPLADEGEDYYESEQPDLSRGRGGRRGPYDR